MTSDGRVDLFRSTTQPSAPRLTITSGAPTRSGADSNASPGFGLNSRICFRQAAISVMSHFALRARASSSPRPSSSRLARPHPSRPTERRPHMPECADQQDCGQNTSGSRRWRISRTASASSHEQPHFSAMSSTAQPSQPLGSSESANS